MGLNTKTLISIAFFVAIETTASLRVRPLPSSCLLTPMLNLELFEAFLRKAEVPLSFHLRGSLETPKTYQHVWKVLRPLMVCLLLWQELLFCHYKAKCETSVEAETQPLSNHLSPLFCLPLPGCLTIVVVTLQVTVATSEIQARATSETNYWSGTPLISPQFNNNFTDISELYVPYIYMKFVLWNTTTHIHLRLLMHLSVQYVTLDLKVVWFSLVF